MKKNLFIVIGMLLLACLGSYLIYNHTAEEKNKPGVTTVSFDIKIDLLEKMGVVEYQVENYVFKKVAVNYGSGRHSFEATMVGVVDDDYASFEILIYDENDNVLDTIEYELVDVFAEEERDIFCIVEKELDKASYFEIVIKE